MRGSTRCWCASAKGDTTYPPAKSTTESIRAGAVAWKTPSATYIVLGTNLDPSNQRPPRYSTPFAGTLAFCSIDAQAMSESARSVEPNLGIGFLLSGSLRTIRSRRGLVDDLPRADCVLHVSECLDVFGGIGSEKDEIGVQPRRDRPAMARSAEANSRRRREGRQDSVPGHSRPCHQL